MGKRKRAMKIESSENETNGDVTIEQEATKDAKESQSKKVCNSLPVSSHMLFNC